MGQKFTGLSRSRSGFFSGVTRADLYAVGKTPSRKDNVANRAINGAKTSAYDFMIDVGMLSTGDDLPNIELISFNTSWPEGSFRVLKNSPVCFRSAYRASVFLPRVDMCDKMFKEMFLILVMKKSASVSHRSLLFTGVSISGACVECSTSRITDHFRRVL